MSTLNSTSRKSNLANVEMTKHKKALAQCTILSEDSLTKIKEELYSILLIIDSPIAKSFIEYNKIVKAKDKIIKLSEELKDNLATGNDGTTDDIKELYEVWVENLLLNYEILLDKINRDELQHFDDHNFQKSAVVSNPSSTKTSRFGFYASEDSAIKLSTVENFASHLPSYFSQLPIGICIATGKDLVYQYANARYLEIIDRDPSIIGNKISDILQDIDSQNIYKEMQKVYSTGEPFVAQDVMVKLDRHGSYQNAYFNIVCYPIKEDDDSISGVSLVCTEVTDLVASRIILEESEHKFRTIIDKSPVAKTILRGADFRVELANKRMLDFFWRRKLEEVQNKPFLEIFPELESQVFPQRLRQVFSSGVAYSENNARAFVDAADGRKEYFFDYEYAPLIDAEGKVDGIMISAYDVTERAKAREALINSEKQFKSIASVMQQFIWTATPEGQLNYFNQAVYDFSGRTEEDLFTNGWLSMVHPDDREENTVLWMKSIETGADFIFEHRFRKANGDYRWQLSRAVPQRDDNGKILQWVGTSTDIHDQIKFQETLEDLVDARTKDLSMVNIELQSSNQDLESFAYISSHDLQEPLRKIQTFISIILDSDYENLSERGKSYFLRVESAAARMKSLITDLLTYSRTSAVEKDFEKVNLEELLEEIQGDFIETLEDKKGSISIEPLPIVSGISFQLSQLFVNLISNSIKFAKEGIPPQINITSRIVSGETLENPNLFPHQDYVEIILKDNGIGFSQEYASKIFEVFQRLHAKGTYDGTGIGLAICKKIIDKHHGLITASSDVDEGATFTIFLPLHQ